MCASRGIGWGGSALPRAAHTDLKCPCHPVELQWGLQPSTKSKQRVLFVLKTTWRQQQEQKKKSLSWAGQQEKRSSCCNFSIYILRASEKTGLEPAQGCGCWWCKSTGTTGLGRQRSWKPFQTSQNNLGWTPPQKTAELFEEIRITDRFKMGEAALGPACITGGGQWGDHEELLSARGKHQGPLCATLFAFCRFCYVCLAGCSWDVLEREFFMLSELIISHGQAAIEQGEITIQGRGTAEHLSS